MKKVKFVFRKNQNAIIVAFLTFLGFAPSCKQEMKYGTPSASFIVKGQVESSQNNFPIRNIRITLNQNSVSTDSNGNYQLPIITDFPGNQTYAIQFKDIDSSLNGAFKELDTVVTFTNPVFTNGDGEWYKGETQKEFDIKLKPQ